MGKWIVRILTLVLAGVFLYSGGRLLAIRLRYSKSEKVYSDLAEEYTSSTSAKSASSVKSSAAAGGQGSVKDPAAVGGPSAAKDPSAVNGPSTQLASGGESGLISDDDLTSHEKPAADETQTAEPAGEPEGTGLIPIPEDERVPIYVNFDALLTVNEDIIGWLYCENSVINYPLVHVDNNDYYLDHNIKHETDPCGSIFSDRSNHMGFIDSNVILYGHHMQNMSMFASLKYWLEQEYYDEHPVMWLLTPEGDYRVDLFSGYETGAKSETYTIFYGPRPEFEEYLETALANSAFRGREIELDGQAHYVVLSTCAYTFKNARTVLHGKLTPIPSVGGDPIDGYTYG